MRDGFDLVFQKGAEKTLIMSSYPKTHFNRRSFLTNISKATLSGVATTLPFSGCRSRKAAKFGSKSSLEASPETRGDYRWNGIGFGIEMSMEIYGVTATQGDRLGQQCEQSIHELEQAFSLYQEDSELSVLNRDRILRRPTAVFRKLIKMAIQLQARTLGYFEPAVHGACLWLEKNGSTTESTSELAGNSAWRECTAACHLKHLELRSDGSIRLTNPLTNISMNAICQGFLADRVAAHARTAGVTSALLHLGETYAIGQHPEGRLWKLAVAGTPTNGEAAMVGEIDFADAGFAVSAQDSTRVMIDPVAGSGKVCGAVRHHERVVAVVSGEGAAVADAYATAFAVSPEDQWPRLARTLKKPGSQVHLWVENQRKFEHVCSRAAVEIRDKD